MSARVEKTVIAAAWSFAIILIALIGFRIGWLKFVDKHELGFLFDKQTGSITIVQHAGYIRVTPFFLEGHTIDLRPSQVCNNANTRVMNCKLVQFDPKGLAKFIEWHGRDAGGVSRELYEILKSYAFNVDNGRDCPFLKILDEMERKSISSPITVPVP